MRDQNGNHVVQKCIECVQPSDPARAMIEVGLGGAGRGCAAKRGRQGRVQAAWLGAGAAGMVWRAMGTAQPV